MKGWAKEQGCVGLENVTFPTHFSDDFSPADKNFSYTGVSAAIDIEHRKPIVGAPFSALISPRTFQNEEPELYEYVTTECPDLFTDACDDYEQLLICFFLMHEATKGKASKWYPVIVSLPQKCEFFADWDEKYLRECQDPCLEEHSIEYKLDCDLQWQHL